MDVGHKQGVSPLHVASWEGHDRTVKVLLERGARVNLKVSHPATFGNTPLHMAASGRHLKTVELLLEYGGDPSVKNNNGDAAIHSACEY